ncbi:hypothetical protein [Limosilactobacillus reuteri]|uniref:hypothetical protein n=1 Tax=Limosilactobacillus reuteri TaxID=1598 RepID=UPI001E559B31|nr:hypothetical protein [Limosilactobacillus reuteri]MCC4331535.1 hypothetical protein [Limosilactobacillus reuteri]MCC4354776.1 hypothetical protein [Limosilactobacillus reuteri]
MAAPTNTTMQADLIAQSIDFTERFQGSIKKLREILGITRLTPMAVGNQIKIYKSTVTKADGTVGEGEVIPLSKVKKELASTLTLDYKKYRKTSTAEAIQASGFNAAVADTDNKLLREVQKDVKADMYGFLTGTTGVTTATATDFKSAIGATLGQLSVKWEDDDIQSVLFVNPIDFYNYLGGSDVTVQTSFGMSYLQNYFGFNTVIISSSIPSGKMAATAADNLNLAYAQVTGSLGTAFNFTTDETGLIGITHNPVNDSLVYQSVIMNGTKLFPERLDGIILTTISKN